MRLCLVILAGCGASSVAGTPCRDMALAMKQFYDNGGAISVVAESVAAIAWCGTEQCRTTDPLWTTVCGSPDDCRYEGHCTSKHDGSVSCDTVQMLGGVTGLAVIVDGDQFTGGCEFREVAP